VRRELVALPESRHEVEAIAADLPKPSTILLGDSATKTNFKQLPLGQFSVIHLALHGYVDPEIPDRSALVFAPQQQAMDDAYSRYAKSGIFISMPASSRSLPATPAWDPSVKKVWQTSSMRLSRPDLKVLYLLFGNLRTTRPLT